MRKVLTTTAIVAALAFAGPAVAQNTVDSSQINFGAFDFAPTWSLNNTVGDDLTEDSAAVGNTLDVDLNNGTVDSLTSTQRNAWSAQVAPSVLFHNEVGDNFSVVTNAFGNNLSSFNAGEITEISSLQRNKFSLQIGVSVSAFNDIAGNSSVETVAVGNNVSLSGTNIGTDYVTTTYDANNIDGVSVPYAGNDDFRLTSMGGNVMRLRNGTDSDRDIDLDVAGGNWSETVTVPANSETFIVVPNGTIRAFEGGSQVSVKAQNPNPFGGITVAVPAEVTVGQYNTMTAQIGANAVVMDTITGKAEILAGAIGNNASFNASESVDVDPIQVNFMTIQGAGNFVMKNFVGKNLDVVTQSTGNSIFAKGEHDVDPLNSQTNRMTFQVALSLVRGNEVGHNLNVDTMAAGNDLTVAPGDWNSHNSTTTYEGSQANVGTTQWAVTRVIRNDVGRDINAHTTAVGNNINLGSEDDVSADSLQRTINGKSVARTVVRGNDAVRDINVGATTIGNNFSATANGGPGGGGSLGSYDGDVTQVNRGSRQVSTVRVKRNDAGRDLSVDAASIGNNISVSGNNVNSKSVQRNVGSVQRSVVRTSGNNVGRDLGVSNSAIGNAKSVKVGQ